MIAQSQGGQGKESLGLITIRARRSKLIGDVSSRRKTPRERKEWEDKVRKFYSWGKPISRCSGTESTATSGEGSEGPTQVPSIKRLPRKEG